TADQHRRIPVKTDGAAIDAMNFLGGSHDHRPMDIALLDAAARDRLLDRDDDHVADRRRLALGTTEYLDALHPPRPGIAGDIKVGLHLDHAAPPTGAAAASAPRRPDDASAGPPITTQCFRFDSGRLSSIRTASPAR